MTDEKTTTYTATLEITPEMEEWAEKTIGAAKSLPMWKVARAILDAKPKPLLLEQAYKIVRPAMGSNLWLRSYVAIGDMSIWISTHHNGRSHGYPLQENGVWTSWLTSSKDDYQIETFGTQQEAMALLVVEMHREDTDA